MPRIESIVIHQGPQGAKGDPSVGVGDVALADGQVPMNKGGSLVGRDFAAEVAGTPAVARVDPGTAGAVGQYLIIGPAGPAWIDEPVFNIRHPRFGATTGATDNIAAINLAAAAANAAGGGTVFVPGGAWFVKPSASSWITLFSNVRLLLAPDATIRVHATTGNFQTVIGAPSEGAAVSNVTVEGGTIDLNPSGNTGATIANVAGQVQNAVRFTNFTGAAVRRVAFDRCCGQNTVLLAGNGCTRAVVIDNDFRFARRGAGTTYDNSAIYVEAIGQEITGNRGLADISEAAFGFIETHNGQAVVSKNRSRGFRTGCNIVAGTFADALLTSNDISVEANDFADAQQAIVLWPYSNGLRNVTIRGNPLSLAQVQHNTINCAGIVVETAASQTGEIVNLVIEGNPIVFEADTRTTAAAGAALSGLYMGGILIGGRGPIRNLTVRGNPVYRSPGSGIRAGDGTYTGEISNAEISGNPLTDCGYNPNLNSAYRIPLYLDGTLTNVKAHDNPIRDTGSPSAYAGNSVRANFTLGTVVNTHLWHNPVTSAVALTASIDRTKVGDYTASASLDFPSVAAGGTQTLTVTVLGAATTDVASASPAAALPAGIVVAQVRVSAADTVSITVANITASPIDPAAMTWVAGVQKRTA